MATIGDRIEQVRVARGWSSREMGRRCGLAEQHIGILVKRFAEDPDTEVELGTLRKIADGAGVALQWLQTGDADPRPPESSRPAYGNMPGYAESEEAGRKRAPWIEDEDWRSARTFSGVTAPGEVSVDFVIALATAARELRRNPGLSAESKKIDAQMKGDKTRYERKLAKQKSEAARANDTGAALVLTAPKAAPAKRAAKTRRR